MHHRDTDLFEKIIARVVVLDKEVEQDDQECCEYGNSSGVQMFIK